MSDVFKRIFPKAYFARLQENGIRIDGRANNEFREVVVVRNAVNSADSSVLCTIGRTSVLCGVRYEVGAPFANRPNDGRVEIKIDVGGLCSPNPSDTASLELEQLLQKLVNSGLVKTSELCIQPLKAVWVLKCHLICLDDD